jgi:Ca2+-binding EF-hand superfamily protein
VSNDDIRAALDNNDEADSAFSMFGKDMNGDVSMEKLEAVLICVEIGRERKAIIAC